MSAPIRRICSGCCARATRGHAHAAPPKSQVHSKQHRIKLGDQDVMSADVARSAAKEAAYKIEADPKD
jgi:hypothetical protein